MNARNLNRQSATAWARIDQMTDEEIDTSDIPPLTDAFFAKAKLRLPRLYINLKDLRDARKFAAYILRRKLHDKKTELRQLERLAFNTALIITYSRPFKGSNNFKGQAKSSLNGHEHAVLKEADKVALHRQILGLRDRAYAHSDARSRFEGLDSFMRPVEILNKAETAQLSLIIEKWIHYLEAEKSKLKESLGRPR